MAYEETGGRIAETKYAMEFDNYSPSAIGDEFTDGDADVPSYESFDEAFQAIGKFIKSLFGDVDDVKDEAKSATVTIPSGQNPSAKTVASESTRVVAKNKKTQKAFAEAGMPIALAAGAAGANKDTGESFQGLAREAWVNPDNATAATNKATTLFGEECAKRRGKGETADQAIAAEFAAAALSFTQGRPLNASSVLNLFVNFAGKIISRSQDVTQSTKHPKPERSYVSQQNAQQQKQAAAAVAMFASLAGGAGGKRITTPIAGAFSQFAAAGMAGSFQPDQGIVYEFPVENGAGEIEYVLDKDLQARYGTSPAA